MITTTQTPATQNKVWGFWGTMGEHAAQGWPLAMRAISDATQAHLYAVRAFLDSRMGRHFADDVQTGQHQGLSLHDAVAAATDRWMSWAIDSNTSKHYDIPRGMSYLTGFVVHCEIIENTLAH